MGERCQKSMKRGQQGQTGESSGLNGEGRDAELSGVSGRGGGRAGEDWRAIRGQWRATKVWGQIESRGDG